MNAGEQGAREQIADALVRLGDVPRDGRDVEIGTTGPERTAIANRLGILSVDALSARLRVRPLRGGLEVKGRLQAHVTQACVISFVPVSEQIDEPVERVFLPGKPPGLEGPANTEIFVDLEEETLPDHFEGSELDLSELLVETLSLALDPYPRHPDAEIPKSLEPKTETAKPSPFDKLKSLKPPGD